MMQVWIAGAVFLLTYALIISERVHRTVSALLGGVVMLLVGVIHQDEALAAIDWNVIFLLAGMMVIANLLRETGLFQWIGIQAVKLGRGQPFRILVILSLVTAASSALLDNVTIVILVVPVTLFVAASLETSPFPFLVAEILASNIGGTATLIGDPPNILIGSAADIDFVTFAANMMPITFIILAVFLVYCWFRFRRELRSSRRRPLDIDALETEALITDRRLLRKALIVVCGVLVGFLTHAALHYEPATIALAGATILLVWTRRDPHAIFRDVEWTTLLFFVGLFITVEAVAQVGIIEAVAGGFLRVTHGSIGQAATALLWLSAIASGVVDNIPYTAAMIPVVETLGRTLPIEPLWWSLALGACLGGNATLIGASANVVVADLAARSGHPISFRRFLGYGLVVTVFSVLLATGYIWLRYL
jgi:Na+/H+ antiporter NhaD/arsenite permease-like protein